MMDRQKERARIAKNVGIKPGKIYTAQKTAEIIGMSYAHLRRLILKGEFPSISKKYKWIKIGGYQIIDYLLPE